eukprot:60196-Amphidinium_carterae.1
MAAVLLPTSSPGCSAAVLVHPTSETSDATPLTFYPTTELPNPPHPHHSNSTRSNYCARDAISEEYKASCTLTRTVAFWGRGADTSKLKTTTIVAGKKDVEIPTMGQKCVLASAL